MRTLFGTLILAVALTSVNPTQSAHAQEPFIGEIAMFGYTFCPRGWTEADGQLLAIVNYQALFSLYGTTYGGDGRTTFGLPDLRGRVPIHTGRGAGLTNRPLGSSGGTEATTLTVNQMPAHDHTLTELTSPNGTNPGLVIRNGVVGTTTTTTTSSAGGGQAHDNMPPFQTIRYCVALQGIFPSRN